MPSRFFQRFRRITYSTAYLPEIDGLRFLAIFSVVLILHISHYLDDKFLGHRIALSEGYWSKFIYEGGNGVPLFFIISGFILSVPFARWYLLNEKKVSLRNYFIRRVFRLEPPYIIALVILFVAHVWILHTYSFSRLLPHLVASVFYLHGAVYHSFSTVLPVAWSLEVEVQFYILAPLFAMVFRLRKVLWRYIIYAIIIISSALYWFDVWTMGHVFMYLHYFFCGIMLADLYVRDVRIFKSGTAGFAAGLCALLGYLFIPSIHLLAGNLVKIVCMIVLVHTVLANRQMKKLFSMPWIVLIGGMCYSIYLLHFAIVSVTGHLLMKMGLKDLNPALMVPVALVFAVVVLVVAAVFFLVAEKPFMKPIGVSKSPK